MVASLPQHDDDDDDDDNDDDNDDGDNDDDANDNGDNDDDEDDDVKITQRTSHVVKNVFSKHHKTKYYKYNIL